MTIYRTTRRPSASVSIPAQIRRLELDRDIAARRGEWREAWSIDERLLSLTKRMHDALRPNRQVSA